MSVQSTTSISLSKELSVEESYSKTSVSSVSSSSMESSSLMSSTMIGESITSGDSGISALMNKLDSDLAITDGSKDLSQTMKMSSVEKSGSVIQGENSLSISKSEVSKSLEIDESVQSMSMKSVKEEVSMSKSEMKSESSSKSITKSESISSEVSEEKPPVYVVVMDYSPRPGDSEGLAVTEGQEVEVIDSSKAHKWRVKLRQEGTEGTVPSCYLEKKSTVTPPMSPQIDPKTQAVISRREKVLKELVESEEAFARDMQYVVNNYIQEMESKNMTKQLKDYKDTLFSTFSAISDFHNNVLMKGLQYYADDPPRIGKTFLRLERDFDMHVAYCRDEPEAQQLLQSGPLKEHFDEFSKKIQDEKSLSEHLKLPIQRINDYQLLLKELIKYSARLKENTTDLEKAYDFMQAIPQRIADLQYINSIQGYKGNIHKLGRILKHDWFEVTDGNGLRRERFVFLFKGRIFITDHKRVGNHRSIYLVKYVLKLPDVEIVDNADDDEQKLRFQSLKPGVAGFPFTLKSKTLEQKEDWLNSIQVSSAPHVDDLGDEEEILEEAAKIEEFYEKHETKVEVVEDFEAYEEMQTVVTESVRSGSLTSLEEGVEVALECEICSNPDATVAWLKNNAPLTSTQRAILQADGGKHRLLIKKTECSDSGLYTIIASNINGTTSCSAPLTVSSALPSLPPTTPDGSLMPYGPIFREKLRNTELQVGTDFRVCVIVEGEPKPEVKFYKNDEEIGSVGRVRYNQEDKECYELIIDNVMLEDAGKYSCVLTSPAGQNVSSCDISVTSGLPRDPEAPKITAPQTKVEAKEGGSALLELTATGFPKPVITWSKDGQELKMGDKCVLLQEDEETYTMAIKNLTPDDTGKYAAEAINDMGEDKISYDLIVTGPPKFKKQMEDTTAVLDEDVVFSVDIEGSPEPSITWSKDGSPLSETDRIKMVSDGKTKKLIIKKAQTDDAGNYSCIIKNENGSQGAYGTLKVKSPAKIVKGLSDISCSVDEDVTLSVTISGSPKPSVKWMKDGKEVKADGNHIIIKEESETTYTLIIKKVTQKDTGEYSCEVSNEHGKDTSKGKLSTKVTTEKASFKKGLKDLEASEGEDLTLNIKLTGTPKPSFKWTKDGNDLKIDNKRIELKEEEDGTSLTLTVHKCTAEDSGKYECKIANPEGSDATSSKMTVKEKTKAPSFKKELTNITVKEEETVELTVKFTGKPKVKWTKDDAELKIDNKHFQYKKEEAEDSLTLIINKATKEDTGKYSCTITNEVGSATTSSKVTVQSETKAASFEKGLKDVTVKEEETVTLTVKFTGKPKPTAKWNKDGAELKIDKKHFEQRYEEAEDSLTLVLNKATKEDTGTYSCVISNEAGSDTTSCKLNVTASTKAPSFEKKLKDITVKEDETVSFTVKFTGNPKPTTKWNKDGAELTIDKKHFELRYEEASDSLTLVLNKAKKEDAGTYSCVISNEAGSETTSSKLVVTAEETAPSFVKGLKDQTVKENETVNFTVKFAGKPKPTAKWNKDGAELKIDGKHFEFRSEEAEDSLTIILNKATKEDAGTYSCTISNSVGSETTSSKLEVKETTTAPSFRKQLKNVTTTEDETIELTVEYEGSPKPKTKWEKDGSDIKIDDDHYELKKEDNSETLVINDVTPDDSGKYSCIISNSEGSTTTDSVVTVKEETSAPKFLKELKDMNIKEEQTANFTVKFSGKPKPTVKWMKDGYELGIDDVHIQSVVEGENSVTMSIIKASKEDIGTYTCTISNSEGSESTSCKLKVSEATLSPEFTQKLKDKEVKEGMDVEFVVKFTGKPQPTAKWTFDGEKFPIDGEHIEQKFEDDYSTLKLIIHNATKDDAGKYGCTITNTLGSETCSARLTVTMAPVFTKPLEDIEAEEGASLKINVKFEGQPDPSVSWTKDGKPLEMDGKKFKTTMENDDSISLLIEKMKPEDAGKYSCEIKNSHGSASSASNVRVSGKPVIKKGLADKHAFENDTNVEVTVEATGTPAPEIKWFLKDQEIKDGDNFILSKDENKGIYKLTVKKYNAETTGELKFEASNASGKAESKGNLFLLQKPVFVKGLKDLVINEEEPLKLEVTVSGIPTPEVTWYYGPRQKEIRPEAGKLITGKDNKHMLLFEESSVEDSGTYVCKAINRVGEVSQTVTVTVKSKGETQNPTFVTHLCDQNVVVGDAERMEVKITGKPDPDVVWFRGDEELSESDNIIIKKDAENITYSLTLKNLKASDSSKYSCKAVNKYGEAKETAELTVKEPVAPHIEELEDAEVRYGAPTRLTAKISGFPSPDVKWIKDDSPLTSKDGYEVIADVDNHRYSVAIKSVKAEELGSYTCIATNSAGEAKAQCKLTIKSQMPAFVKDISDQSIDMGEPFTFEAEIYGYPTPEVTWCKDNKALEGNTNYTISSSGDIFKLQGKIRDVEDAGVIVCRAKNVAGEDSRKANLKVNDFAPIMIEKLPEAVNLTENDKLTLKAKVGGKPMPSVKWLKDGKELRPSNKMTTTMSPDGVAELTVLSVNHNDAGRYKLEATNEKGRSGTESTVSVGFQEKDKKPFVGQLHGVDVTVGNPIVLEAKVMGHPPPKIEWFKDGNKLVSGDHVQLSEKDNKAVLNINSAKIEDTGEYKLVVSSDVGEDSSTAAVTVSVAGKKPTIVKELKAVKLQEGEEGKLEVVVTGHPKPTVAWMHNGRNVMEGQHCTCALDDNGRATLTIHNVKCEDAGLYSAIASNKHGRAMSEAPVIVTPIVKGETEKKPTKVFEFLQSLMPQLVPEGKTCTLEARVTTDPKPVSVKWIKDGKEIPPSERVQISQDSSGLLKLCISSMTSSDRGKYAVIVSDGNTEIRSESLVNMMPAMPGISANKPNFIKGLEPQKVNEGGTIKLQAQLPPDQGCKIKWMKDGDDIVKNDRTQILEQHNGQIALVIEAAMLEDSGKYVVTASNDEGKTRSSANVAVVGAGFKLPEVIDALQPASFVQGDTGKLVAKVSGEPTPEVKWLHDGVPVEPSDRIKIQQQPDGTVSLEIRNVKPEDAGKYTILVSNLGGEMRSSAKVDVIQSPLFLNSLQPAVGVVGSPAHLECKVSGDPAPDIKWTKDGTEVSDDDLNIRKQQLPGGEVSLGFDKCRPEDAGEYTCTASNKHGTKSSSAPLKVISKEVEGQQKSSPSFVTPLSDLKVEQGDTFRLEVTVSGNPLPDIHWFLDDQPVSLSDTLSVAFDGRKATLTVYRCNPRHEGVYECKISNNQGEASTKGKVTVLAYEPPKFIERLADAQFLTNEPMKLECRVKGIPSPDVEWYFNRQRIEDGVKYTMLREGDKCAMTIPHPRIKDSGIYECRARNEAGKDSCSANIAVSGADTEGEPPMFLKKLRDVSVMNGMTARLTACICGTPKPEVKWFKDGNQLSPSSRISMEADRNGVIRLIIDTAHKSDIGTYRVSIANKFGSDTCTGTLNVEGLDKIKSDIPKRETPKPTVQGPPSPLAHAPYIFKMTDNCISLGWRPSIPQFPQVPTTYRLEMCKASDNQWSTYKSGIKDSSCDVKDLLPGIDYLFRVRVENRYGVSEPSPFVSAHRSRLISELTPEDKTPKDYELEHLKLDKHAAAPRFLRLEEESAYAVRGHPARVEFWVYGYPTPTISWFFNNMPVEREKYDFLEDRNGQVILFIVRMGDDDVGTYTCKAVNEHGEAQRKIQLMIAEPPIFTKRLEPVTVMIRKGGELKCKVIGTPYPKIKWFKDWQPLAESSRIHIKWEEPDCCTLALNDSILKDGGLYSCAATNVAGTSTTSAMFNIEEVEDDYLLHSYQRPPMVKPSSRPFEDFYDIGDELGRGTQGITYHVVERKTGRSLAAKSMHGAGDFMDYMKAEMDIMNQLCHPRLVRLWDAHEAKSSLTLAMDMCGGGELLPNIIHQGKLTETTVAHYIKQILEGLQHMHEKNIAHLGLTIGDVLLTRLNCDNIKLADFGLATRLYPGRDFIQEYGHPEFVAPEISNKQPVSLAADMWSVGIIAYILLVGDSPFLRENDRETLKEVQKGKADFYHEGFAVLSDEARDFVQQLLHMDPTKRMDVNAALKHKWLELDSIPDMCDELENMDRLREYYRRWKAWYSNASCRWFFRRRTLESCFTHPSRMIYPPDEEYTPPVTPDGHLERSRVKPAAFDDVTYRQRIEREAIDPKSESHYQNGPDTFLLPLRDPDFPVRVRRYLKVGAHRSPLLARHLKDKHWGYQDVAVRERRKFVDIMDEEIDDEKKGLSKSANMRLRHEVGTPGSGYEHLEVKAQKKKRGFRGTQGTAPFFREKIKHCVIHENEEAVFSCRVAADPEAQVSWFRNDGILIESSRIIITKWSDGRCSLTLRPAKAYDIGVYKCVARNSHGVSVCRARLHLGTPSAKPDPPKADRVSDTEIFLNWMPPKFDGFSPTYGYALEYKEKSAENWTKLANNIAHEFYLVRNLTAATTYYFRICAVNKFGWSEFSVPSDPIMTLAESAPKIELSRAEKFQQDQTDNGQELILDSLDQVKLDYDREDDPVILEEGEPTELYNYISEVARGRFSLVMKVWNKKVNGAFVAKAIDATDESARKEFEVYKSLQHEKIAHLHSASVSKTSLFLVMEKLSGIDVLTYLSSKPLYTEDLVSRIIHQVIDGLEYLHFRGICYFELQPDNVVMEDRHHPNIKLVDFGTAQFVPEEGGKMNVRGSIEYLAPEVLKCEDVCTPADIWGVGVLTYILLSGVSPFAGENAKETKDNVLYVRYHFDHLYKEVSPEATHFLMQLFKRTPQKRPTTEECLENKWLLPNEFMIKKREHAVFLSHNLRDFSEHYHSEKSKSTPNVLLNIFGKTESR